MLTKEMERHLMIFGDDFDDWQHSRDYLNDDYFEYETEREE